MIILGIAFSLVPSAMWPSVAKIFPAHRLGTAYALIFFIQNIGLVGRAQFDRMDSEEFCITGTIDGVNQYDYTIPMLVFTGFATLSLVIGLLLKVANKKYGYGLEKGKHRKEIIIGQTLDFGNIMYYLCKSNPIID